jgi:iron complex outermembrane receptor protein
LSSQNKIYLRKFKLDVNAAYQNTELIHFAEPEVYEIQMKLATLTYETKLHLPTHEKSEYIFGFQGLNQVNTNLNNRETILLPDATTNNYSFFGLLQYNLTKKIKFQTGLRYDIKVISTHAVGLPADEGFREALDKKYGSLSGSFGTTYQISEKLNLRANFAAAFRTPNLAELTSNGQHETRYEIGNQDLVPENSYEGDVSMHYHVDNFTFDLAGFYNQINNYIYISTTVDTTDSGIPIYRYYQTNSVLFGGEAGIHIHPKPVKWLHIEASYSSVTGKQNDGDYLPFIPANKVKIELRAEAEKLGFVKNAFALVCSNTSFDQNNAAPDETPTKGYTLIDFSLEEI